MKMTDITVPVLETVGDFFSNDWAYVGGTGLLVVLLIVWALMQVSGWVDSVRSIRESLACAP